MEWSQLSQVALSFLLVVGLMFGLAALIKRLGLEKTWGAAKSSAGMMRVADSLFLDPKRRMMIVQVEHKRYVILLDQERAHVLERGDTEAD